MKMLLGIDWGGTYIKSGIVNSKGKILPEFKPEEGFYRSDCEPC